VRVLFLSVLVLAFVDHARIGPYGHSRSPRTTSVATPKISRGFQ